MLRLCMVCLLSLGLIGCASAQKKSKVQDLENQVSELQMRLQESDEKYNSLKSELDAVRQREARKDRVLRQEGYTKPDNKQVQQALKNAGFYTGLVDGRVGPKTQTAIKEFQKSKGLKEDGVIGRQTWAELSAYIQ